MKPLDFDLNEFNKAIRSGLDSLRARPPLRLSRWADEHFYLSAESSYAQGGWKSEPEQVFILDCMGSDEIEELSFQKSKRYGYTKMLLAFICFQAEHKRRNTALWQPTDDDRDEFVKVELEPVLRDAEVMQPVFPEFLKKHKNNTLKQKTFIGSILHLRGGKSAGNFRRLTVDSAVLDELDGFDSDVDKEGDPGSLAAGRIDGAVFPKLIKGSTPTIEGFSLIETSVGNADLVFRRYIPCPHCGHEHYLQWGGKDEPHGFKWQDDKPETVAYCCPSCSSLYTQAEYLSVRDKGRWIAHEGKQEALYGMWYSDADGKFYDADGNQVRPPKHIGVKSWAAYRSRVSWSDLVRRYLDAVKALKAGNKSLLKTFINQDLGETFKEDYEKTDEHALKSRAEAYPLRTVPKGGLVLVAGVDVQGNRFEITVWAIGRGEEMWPVDYTVLEANPADEREWMKLDAYLDSTFPHECGATLRIEAASVDSGGHWTHQAYNFGRRPRGSGKCKVYITKGESRPGKPVKSKHSFVDVNHKGKVIKRGAKLWLIGTDTAKDLLHGRLQVAQPGPGYVHFSKELPDAFYKQLTSEARIPVKSAGEDSFRWVKPAGVRNEVLDCTVGAIFCAHALDLHRYTDKMWDRQEQAVQPAVGDLFHGERQPVQQPAPSAVQSGKISLGQSKRFG